MKMTKTNHTLGIARIRFHLEDGKFFWSLPIFYQDIVQLDDIIASAKNIPVGTVYDLQCVGVYETGSGRLVPRKSRAFMAKNVRKLQPIIEKAPEGATPEPPKAAIETQCENL